ncbi:cysteine dioxygenase family protein [Acidimangrovimonas sediminis]|uniref:cysteine dioxygenase family protein n=1 Tax=Acidimangrovimonas sediminis TaxID=2056283 RepID=UPI000C800968|nr:cysteine dioxygenase [Acidimangrovimonas sediminis]
MTGKLRQFVDAATATVAEERDEGMILDRLKGPLGDLIAVDDWLPEAFTRPHPEYYQQYLLHCDPLERFSVVSFVWGPGQKTPIHNHTVWGMIGMLRGAEISTRFAPPEEGAPMAALGDDRLDPGDIDLVSPDLGDYHQVRNAFDDRVSISIHVYGSNIGRVQRQVFDGATGTAKSFVSGFSADVMPNIWG